MTSAALLLCAFAASAAQPAAPAPEALTPAPGLMIFVDPNTGEVRQPTVAEWAQLPQRVAPKAKVSPQQILPDGTIYVPAEAVMQRMTATLDADGNVHVDCNAGAVAP